MTHQNLKETIEKAFPAALVSVEDVTGGGNHFQVHIQDNLLAEKSRMESQREVMTLFSKEFASGELHALALKITAKST